MAVQITKPGKTQAQMKYKTKCLACECEFTFHGYDATGVVDQRDGNYYTIPCPQCFVLVTMTKLEKV